jgi:response regulator of citrate/malate metabolism
VLAERLDAYRRLWERTNRLKEADQQDVDSVFGLLRASDPAPAPKGHSAPTLALVREAFQDGDSEWSATEVAEQVGISRPTAQRYLAHLVRSRLLELHLRYGTTGRPEHRYRRDAETARSPDGSPRALEGDHQQLEVPFDSVHPQPA